MQHQLKSTASERLKVLSPFGIGLRKPRHFADMLKVAWKNKDNLPYAWKVLSKGVCDGCALGVAGFHDWTIEGVHLCMTRLNLLRLNTMPEMEHSLLENVYKIKAKDNAQLRELGRLAHPMLRKRGDAGFHQISWNDAISRIAARIKATTPDRLAFYLTSRGITNEVYYVAQKAARLIGTNSVDNAARLCHSPSTGAMKAAIGWGASTCSYKDWFGTDLIVFFGSNPANDQPVAMKYLDAAKSHGTKVVLVNPYLEPGMKRYWVPSTIKSALVGTKITDYWYPVTQGGDVAFLYGVIKHLLENEWIAQEFIERHTLGVEELVAKARLLTWPELESRAGLSRESMLDFAKLLAGAKNAVLVWSMGITQHVFGADAVAMILNLALLRGYVGREKTGVMPIRGHSGVQGGAEMGAYSTALPGGKPITPESARALSSVYGFDIPDRPGLTATEMVESAHRGELDVFYCVGGNFLRTLPNPDYVAEALAKVPLRIHQDIILTDQMLIDPAERAEEVILLPAKTRYEQDGGGTETTTERRVIFGEQLPRQVGEARSEWQILRDLALAVRPEFSALFGCSTGAEIRSEIARVVPLYDGMQHLSKTGDQFQYGGARLADGGIFNTPDQKGHFRAVPLPEKRTLPGTFFLSTRRGKQFNTLIYAEVDPLNGAARDAVLMNSDDAAELRLKHGDPVLLASDCGNMYARVHLAPIARANVQVHFPEGNPLLPKGCCDAVGGVPDYNAIIRITKCAEVDLMR
jgi:molybdopterin-dependent oxidoreductase alpha subunit